MLRARGWVGAKESGASQRIFGTGEDDGSAAFPGQESCQARQLTRGRRLKSENQEGGGHGHLYNLRPFRA
jgi:hypothetical protein